MLRISAVVVEEQGLRIGEAHWPWPECQSGSIRNLLVAGAVTLNFADGKSLTVWGSSSQARALHARIEAAFGAWALASRAAVIDGLAAIRALLDEDRYLSRRVLAEFRGRHPEHFREHLVAGRALAKRGDTQAAAFLRVAENLEAVVDERNGRWSSEEQERWGELFDTVEKKPLTDEQRKAVVDFEDRNLLVAAAGSGKSSTLVAKIAYAVRKGLFAPDEVLALAFNKDAARELGQRIGERLKDIPAHESIRSETFHGLGYRILGAEQKQTVDQERDARVREVYNELKAKEPQFRRDIVHFILAYTPDIRDRTTFSSYEEYLEYQRSTEQGRGEKGRRVETLSGDKVASVEEMRIANWLFIHGVPFEYEKTYPLFEASRERRSYLPDFYYPEIEVWHEHFGVDAKGRPAPCIGDPEEYVATMAWKRECHQANGTRLIETSSSLFAANTIYGELEARLRAHGQRIRELSTEEIDRRLTQNEHNDFTALLTTFISHWKSKRIPFDVLMERGSPRDRAFLPICRRVYEEYQARLARDRRVDFDDLILGATDAVREGRWRSPFGLILVDEFQDISPARADLVRALLAQREGSVLFCVGDDWQAINGFAGSELGLMRNFEKEFGFHALNRLTRTFRSNQGIASAAKDFVERNPSQIRKAVISHDATEADCLRVMRYRSHAELQAKYEAIAREVAEHGGKQCTVRILGRYRRNADSMYAEVFARLAPNAKVELNTMHGSKGLEADYVVLDRVEGAGSFAFPSRMTDDSVLLLVMPEKERFPHAEERRLMYVALTRARRRVYILTQVRRESPFVLELERSRAGESAPTVYACPYCKGGKRVQRSGKHGLFWSCSRYPACPGKKQPALSPRPRGRR